MTARVVLPRLGAGLLGGWLWVFGQTALGAALAARAGGMPFEDAEALFVLFAYPVFVVVFSWAFLARTALRAWAVLAGGGALMTLAGWLVGRGAV